MVAKMGCDAVYCCGWLYSVYSKVSPRSSFSLLRLPAEMVLPSVGGIKNYMFCHTTGERLVRFSRNLVWRLRHWRINRTRIY